MIPYAASALMAVLAAAPAAQDPAYTTTTLGEPARADSLHAEDFDGDGRADLLVQSGRDLKFFLFRAPDGFRAEPDQVLRLKPAVFLWTLARMADDTRLHLVTASARGLQRHARSGPLFAAKPEDLVVHPNLLDGAASDSGGPLRIPFMPDLDGDGLSDALLFDRGEAGVFIQRRDSAGRPDFRLTRRLPLPIDTALQVRFGPHQTVDEMTSVPVLTHGDMNGDRLSDIAYCHNETLGVFFRAADGSFSAADPRALAEKRRKPRSTYIKFDIPPRILDVNGDGLLDIVTVYPSKGRTHVFLNREGRVDFTNPDAVLKTADAWSTGFYLEDLDRDGRQEIVMGIIRKFGIIGGLDVFTSKKVDLELHIFSYSDAMKNYPTEPAQQLRFSIPFTMQATRDSANIDLTFRPDFDADVNGDGRQDLLVEKGPDLLAVYYGAPKQFIADAPGGTIAIRPPPGTASTRVFAADFNGDGRSDLVLRHFRAGENLHALEVKMSKP